MRHQNDYFLVETTEDGIGFYADRSHEYFEMSTAMAEYLIKKLNAASRSVDVFFLITCAVTISMRRNKTCILL